MAGPWEKYQSAPAGGPWEKYADHAEATAPAVEAHPAVDMKEPDSIGGATLRRLGDTASSLLRPILHPSTILSEAGWVDPGKSSDLISDIQQNPNQTGIGNALGDILSAGAMGAVGHFAPIVAEPIGRRMQSAGAGIIDRTAGVLKGDVSRGSQPGRAYLEGGGGPVMSLKGLGESARKINQNTGKKLGEAYKNSSAVIPAGDVMQSVQEPIAKLRNIQNAPGGTGSPASLNEFEDNLFKPIWDASSRGGFTPSELFSEMKQPISQNTRWNDPTMYDLNKVRQETTGKIGDLLTTAVPETKPLNKIYQGTSKLAARAEARSATGQTPLRNIGAKAAEIGLGAGIGHYSGHPLLGALPFLADTVPAKTTAASALFKGGRAVPAIGGILRNIVPVAGIAGAGRPKPRPKNNKDGENK